jgi:hypothetical protein
MPSAPFHTLAADGIFSSFSRYLLRSQTLLPFWRSKTLICVRAIFNLNKVERKQFSSFSPRLRTMKFVGAIDQVCSKSIESDIDFRELHPQGSSFSVIRENPSRHTRKNSPRFNNTLGIPPLPPPLHPSNSINVIS